MEGPWGLCAPLCPSRGLAGGNLLTGAGQPVSIPCSLPGLVSPGPGAGRYHWVVFLDEHLQQGVLSPSKQAPDSLRHFQLLFVLLVLLSEWLLPPRRGGNGKPVTGMCWEGRKWCWGGDRLTCALGSVRFLSQSCAGGNSAWG